MLEFYFVMKAAILAFVCCGVMPQATKITQTPTESLAELLLAQYPAGMLSGARQSAVRHNIALAMQETDMAPLEDDIQETGVVSNETEAWKHREPFETPAWPNWMDIWSPARQPGTRLSELAELNSLLPDVGIDDNED
mmetsp:Transcript_29452/g.47057  ORF Transcript_29452/g.47057 Transcript_29452/m.47057 type:complete len:138 (-) Transcript_29452:178-591(-)|eukprot:CAMPEP_0169133520 /NCGR_PEP_ID=MMETSP1015-20121227/39355_1 /TAXON_ID=342587 /ORGANISM="Karlodinium micrum, Strain CCMP2283" /LENGTH=137 /DNA_ID=CAMNT_0009197915 /DNA_START=40 /DNA_END=453 /DNA_ORIENTATION=+